MTVMTDQAPQSNAPVAGEAVVEVPEKQTLTKHADRCDRCGAQAFIKAVLPAGTDSDGVPNEAPELLMCAHHGREHMPKLKMIAVRIVDESSFINKAASESSPL